MIESPTIKTSWYQWLFIDHPWLVEIAIVLFLLFFLNIVLKKFLNKSKKMTHLKESDWRYHLEYAAIVPARVLLWVLLGTFVLDLGVRKWKFCGLSYVGSLRNAAIITCFAWFLLRWKKVFYRVMSSRSDRERGPLSLDPFTLEIIGKVFTIAILFLTTLIIMQLLGLNVIPLVTFGGIGAATLGIAGKDVISNFFGGMMIYSTRPFMVNDVIELPERKLIGSIEEIGWYFTSIRDMEKKPLYIPNSVFSTEPIINQSRMTHRRMDEVIAVRYKDLQAIPKILEGIRILFEHSTAIDHRQPIHVFLKNLGEVSIQIEVKAYVLSTRYEDFMEVRHAILAEICKIIDKNGAAMPYPAMEIIMRPLP
jgi:MscS family membrane protein